MQFDIGAAVVPAPLELGGVAAHCRPCVADAQAGVASGGQAHQFIGVGEQGTRAGEYLYAGGGRGDGTAGAVQQPYAEDSLQHNQGAGDRGLGDTEFDRCIGEAACVDDGDQAAQAAAQAPYDHPCVKCIDGASDAFCVCIVVADGRVMATDARTEMTAGAAPPMAPPRPSGIALMLGSGLSNQVGASVAALAFPVLGPVGVVAVRQWVAAAVLLGAGRPKLRSFTTAQWRPVLGLAAVFAAMNLTLPVSPGRT